MLAGLRRRDDDRAVERGRSGHHDRADPRIGKGLFVVGVGRVQLQVLARSLASLRDRLDQGDQAGVGRPSRYKIASVDHPRSSTTDDADTYHGRSQIVGRNKSAQFRRGSRATRQSIRAGTAGLVPAYNSSFGVVLPETLTDWG